MVFHWSLSDSNSPQVSRTHVSILAGLYNAIAWMVSTLPLISKSTWPFPNLLVTVPSALFQMVSPSHSWLIVFFSSLVRYLFLFSPSFNVLCCLLGRQSTQFGNFSVFCWLSLGLIVWPRLGDLSVSQNARVLCESPSPGLFPGCACTICSYCDGA